MTTQQSYSDATRHNMYYAVHRGIRRSHGRLLAAIGSTDFSDETAANALIADVRAFLALSKCHLNSENDEIHSAVDMRDRQATSHANEDHDHHEESFAEIESLLRAIEDSPTGQRNGPAQTLYSRYALFMADDLRHMHEEETELLARMHGLFTDDELRAIEGRIVSKITPANMMGFLRAIIPALSHPERVKMLCDMKAVMPPEVFNAVLLQCAATELRAEEFEALRTAIGHERPN